jgi:hypothetical protein
VEKAHGGEGKQGQTDIIVTGRWRGLVRPYLERPTIAEWNKAARDRKINVGKGRVLLGQLLLVFRQIF